jgi:hypothetical protein
MAKNDKKPITNEDSGSSELTKRIKAHPGLYIGSVVVLVLITITFVGGDFVGSGGRYGRGADLTFGYYDKVPISYVPGNKFSQYYDQIIRRYRDQIDLSDFQTGIAVWTQAFEAAAVHTAILQELKRSNYEVPVKVVDREVARLPKFQDDKGRFSPALYRQESETSLLALWRQVRDELMVLSFFTDLFSLKVPKNEIEFISAMASDMKSFDLVFFPVDDFPDSEYLKFAKENPGLFRSIHLSRIVIGSNEKEAKKVLDSINNEATTFEDAAIAQSQDSYADRGGDMGIRYVFDLEREITGSSDLEKILSLGKGAISDIVKLDAGWAFFRAEDELIQPDFEDTATMDRVKSYMRNFQRGRMEDWAIEQANAFIEEAKTDSFDSAARWRNKEKRSMGPLPLNYGNVDLFPTLEYFSIPEFSRQELGDLSKNTNFWRTVFSTPLNTPSEPLVHGRNVIVFYPTEILETDDYRAEQISSMYSSWLNYTTEQSLQPYFLNSPKMDNRFWDTYYRFFVGN